MVVFLSMFMLVASFDVATLNAHNLSPEKGEPHFVDLANFIARDLHSPAIVALQEVMDADGTADTGRVDGAPVFAHLSQSLKQVADADYRFVQIDPRDGADGGVPGGNIRVGFLLAPGVMSGTPFLLGMDDPAFASSRKPLVLPVTIAGRPHLLINLHLVSRRGGTADFDPGAQRRLDQAQVVATFLRTSLRTHPDTRIVVVGDLNAQLGEPALGVLTDRGLVPLLAGLPMDQRHTLFWQGQGYAYDHILVSMPLDTLVGDVRVVRTPLSDHAAVWARFHDPTPTFGCAITHQPAPHGTNTPAWVLAILWMAWRFATSVTRPWSRERQSPGPCAVPHIRR